MDSRTHNIADQRKHTALPTVMLVASVLVSGWVAIAQPSTALPTSFEVASIRAGNPNNRHHDFMWMPGGRLDAINISLYDLILYAYDIKSNQLVGLPSWAKSRQYTVQAVPPSSSGLAQLRVPQMIMVQRQMLRSLLADRFGLKTHRSTKQLPVYEIVVAKGGAKLKPVSKADLRTGSSYRKDHPLAGGMQFGPGSISAWGVRVSDLTGWLSDLVGRYVVDKTGLSGRYEINLTWTPSPGLGGGADSGSFPDSNKQRQIPGDVNFSSHATTIFTAMKEQLGLKLMPAKGPVQVLVIDHIEPPTPN